MNREQSLAKNRQSLSSGKLVSRTLLALLAGVGAGVFFGEYCGVLEPIGEVYVGLLRMTVLPYIMVSLAANFGRLSARQSRRLTFIGGGILACLWGVALVAVFLLAQTFPGWKQGSFFSVAVVEPPEEFNLLSVFIPSNIFASLARNHVPAVVLVSIWTGIVIAGVSNRLRIVSQLDVVSDVLMKISKSIARFTPVGVFAITAHTSGSLSLEEFGRLQTYLLIYTFGALTLAFVVLPLMVTSFTSFSYRDVLEVAGESMIIAFATGKLIIVIPALVESTEKLFERRGLAGGRTTPAVDVLYPLVYPFPHVGKLLSLLFIPFAAWFLGNALRWNEYPAFLATGVFSYFGGPLLAMPFLLEQMHLPRDMFQLFVLTGLWEGRLGDMLGVMHLVVVSILTTCAFSKQLHVSPLALSKFAVVVLVAIGVAFGCLSVLTSATTGEDFQREDVLLSMQLVESPVPHTVATATPNPAALLPGETLLARIRRRNTIRIGFNEDKLPFAFFNSRGDLVGYDVEMAHALATDLGVNIEFVRFNRETLAEQLKQDDFDVVMSGLVGTLERSEQMLHTAPYMDVTLGLVVPDHEVRRFESLQSLRSVEELRIGFIDLSSGFVQKLTKELPNAEFVELRTIHQYFDVNSRELDALLVSAESGSAFSLLYPNYEVVLPMDRQVTLPLFYAIGNRDEEFRAYLEHWIALKRRDGTMDEFYEHWILGKTTTTAAPRWCVIRDVLGWVD